MSLHVYPKWLVCKVNLDSLKDEHLVWRFGQRKYEKYLGRRRVHPKLKEELRNINCLIEHIQQELYPLQEGEELWEWRNEHSEWERGFGCGGYAVVHGGTVVRFIQTIMN